MARRRYEDEEISLDHHIVVDHTGEVRVIFESEVSDSIYDLEKSDHEDDWWTYLEKEEGSCYDCADYLYDDDDYDEMYEYLKPRSLERMLEDFQENCEL